MKREEYETIDSDKLIQIKKCTVAICGAVENNFHRDPWKVLCSDKWTCDK